MRHYHNKYAAYISNKPLSEQGQGISRRAHTICKHDRLDEESEKINNYWERINDRISKYHRIL